MALDKSAFLAEAGIHSVKEIEVPGLSDAVFIRELSAGERDKMELLGESCLKDPDKVKQYRAVGVAMFLSDADGKRLFSDNETGHIGKMNAKPIMHIFHEGMRFNGMLGDAIEEMAKNLSAAQSGDSSSD